MTANLPETDNPSPSTYIEARILSFQKMSFPQVLGSVPHLPGAGCSKRSLRSECQADLVSTQETLSFPESNCG